MDHHLPQQQQYGDPYRTLVPSPQPDHQLHALQYQQQQQPMLMSPPQPQSTIMSPPLPQQQQQHASLASHFHLLHVSSNKGNYYYFGREGRGFVGEELGIVIKILNRSHGSWQNMYMSITVDKSRAPVNEFEDEILKRKIAKLVNRLGDPIATGTRDQNFDALVEELTSQFGRCQQLLNSISGTLSSKSTTVDGQRQSLEEMRQLLDQRKELIAKYRSSVDDLINGDTR